MNKKTIMLASTLLLAQIAPNVSAGLVDLSVTSASNTYQVGDVFTVLVEGSWTPDKVTNDIFDDLITGGIELSFNANTLQINTAGNGISLLAPADFDAITGTVSNTLGTVDTTGFYSFTGIQPDPGAFQMASFEFIAIAGGSADINVFSTTDRDWEWFDGESNIPTVNISNTAINVSAVPVPAAIWFMATGLISFMGFRRKAAVC